MSLHISLDLLRHFLRTSRRTTGMDVLAKACQSGDSGEYHWYYLPWRFGQIAEHADLFLSWGGPLYWRIIDGWWCCRRRYGIFTGPCARCASQLDSMWRMYCSCPGHNRERSLVRGPYGLQERRCTARPVEKPLNYGNHEFTEILFSSQLMESSISITFTVK